MLRNKKFYMIIARVIFYGTALLLIVFVGAFLFLQSGPAKEAVTRLIEDAVAQNTQATCRIEKLRGNLFSRFEVIGFELADAKTGVPWVTARKIDVSYSIPMLLGRVLWVNALAIDGVNVNLVQDADGRWNFESLVPEDPSAPVSKKSSDELSSAPSPGSGPAGFRVEIRQLQIQNSAAAISEYLDTGESVWDFTKINCRARLNIGKEISAKINQLTVRLDDPQISIENLSGNLRYDIAQSLLDINDARVKGEKSDFTISGLLRFLDDYPDADVLDLIRMDLRADIEKMSLGEFGRAFPIQMPDSDIVSGKLSVTGPVSRMDCRVDLRMDQCHVKSEGLVTIDANYDVGLDIKGKIKGLDLAALPVLELESFSGTLNSDFSLFWQQIGMPDQTGRIQLDMVSSLMRGYFFDAAKVDVRIGGPDFIFDTIDLKTPYGNLAGSGSLAGIMASDMDNQVQFTADVYELNPEKIIKDSRYAGRINARVRSSVFIPKTFDPEEITADASCRINPSQLMDIDIRSGNFDASWQNGTIFLKQSDMETSMGTASLTGTASVRDETCRFKANAAISDLKLIRPFIPELKDDDALAGSVSVNADITGSWYRPEIIAAVSGEKFNFRDVSADFLSATSNWQGDLKAFKMSGSGSAENLRISGLLLSLMEFSTEMTPASVHADIEILGEQQEKLSVSGSVGNWTAPEKEVLIEKISLVSFDQPPLVNRKPVKLSISPERIRVDALHLDSGNASLVLKGEAVLNPQGNVSADLALRDFNLRRIAGFWEGGSRIQGRLSSEIAVSGVLEKPIIHMTASVKEFGYDSWPVTDITAALDYQDAKIKLTGDGLRQGRKILDINGSGAMQLALYPFAFVPRPESFLVSLNTDQVDISEISGFIGMEDQLQGTLTSHLTLSGRPENPVIKIDLSIKDGVIDKFSFSEAAAAITYSGSKASVNSSVYRSDKKLMDINGTAGLAFSVYPFEFVPKPGGLDLALNVDQVDIAWISDIINDPEYDISGIIDVSASVSGDFDQPRIQGNVSLNKGALELKRQQLAYEDLSMALRFSDKTIFIEKMNVKGDKEGSLELSGRLTHDKFKPQTFDVRAVGDKFYIPYHSGVDVRINPDLTLTGTWESPVVQGKIEVYEGRVNLERFLENKSEIEIVAPVTVENGMLQIPEKDPEPLAFVDPLTADVAVIIPNDFWFKGAEESIEIKGRIQLKKNPRKPFVLYGSVFPVRGTYRFRGRMFQIRQGEITFAGQEDINPSVNIEAVNVIDDIKIIIRLSGTFEYLNLVLDSDPAMDQAEIISFLIFGRAPDDLSEKESFQAGEAALSFTGQIAADKLRDIVGDTLGFDYLNISAGSGGLRQGSLTMGKYVLPKVFVTFRQGFDETVTQKVEVTYEINKNFDLETQIDNEQTSALDLIWKYEF